MCVGQTKSHSHPIVANKKWEGRSIARRDGDYSNWPLTFELFCSRLYAMNTWLRDSLRNIIIFN